jgi:hypothetical protein
MLYNFVTKIALMAKITLERFQSIGPDNAAILKKKCNILTVDDFLKFQHNGRLDEIKRELKAERMDPTLVDDWKEILDLFRIPMLTARDAEILHACNINSVEELSYRDAYQILSEMKQLDSDTYFIILDFPAISIIENWIYYAKLLTRKIKIEAAIPLINFFPIVTIENSVEFQKYRIWTVEDFEVSYPRLKRLRESIGMKLPTWEEFLTLIDFVRVKNVTVQIAKLIYSLGIHSLKHLRDSNADHGETNEPVTKEIIEQIIETAKNTESIRGGK